MVRAIDVPQWLNVALPADMSAIITSSLTGPSGEHGCADASLYRRVREAGLTDVRFWPHLTTRYPERDFDWAPAISGVVGSFSPTEAAQWDTAVAIARADGGLVSASPVHCAVGTRPLQ